MHSSVSRSFFALCGTFFGAAIAGGFSGLGFGGRTAIAQDLAACPPPAADEFLVLAIANDTDAREAAIEGLDGEYPAQTCTYLDDTVIRVSGFTDSQAASGLARGFTDNFGLSAFVTRLPEDEPEADPQFAPRPYGQALELPEVQVVDARPAGDDASASVSATSDDASDDPEELPVFTPEDLPPPQIDAREPMDDTPPVASVPPPSVAQSPRANSGDRVPPPFGTTDVRSPRNDAARDGEIVVPFNPQPLADGFVVLVDYFNDPSVASDVAAVTGQAVGLVSYGRRPFLMADFTTDEDEAKATLEALGEIGLWPLVVDSQRAVLLTPRVRLDP
ncbi:MAG: hypothetical protein ACFB9N_16625 [Geitlerinemataceae cyanobacterium]